MRGATSSSLRRPLRARRSWKNQAPLKRNTSASCLAMDSTSSPRSTGCVRTLMPDLTRARWRGDAMSSPPSASAMQSTVNSSPGKYSEKTYSMPQSSNCR
ncbi:hypothetical protein D9M71_368600 [compost metagenome]